jgi:hypothetical protein
VVSTLNLRSKKDIRSWLDRIEQAQIDDIIIMRMPFLQTPFDVNDLGIFSGLAYMALMLTLWFAMVRQQENLYLSMWKVQEMAREDEGAPQGRANLLYHALSMTQLFTTPPTLARWNTGFTDSLPRLFFLIPPLMHGFVIYNDLKTYERGSMVNAEATFVGWWIEVITFVIITTAAVICVLHARASDCIWIKTFRILNPSFDLKIQPSWREWVRLKKKAQAPGWGIAVPTPSPGAENPVFVADFRDGKIWKFTDPGSAPPELVVEKRCRELGVSPDGRPYGEHIPHDPPSKKWTYSRWSHTTEGCKDDLSPTFRPPLGQGVLRDGKGSRYSIDGRGPGAVQILYKSQDGNNQILSLAGGRRGILDGKGREAGFEWVQDMTVTADRTLYVTDGGCIRQITEAGVVTTLGGNPIGAKPRFRRSRLLGVAVTEDAIYAADYDFHHIWKVSHEGAATAEVWNAGPWWSPAGLACAGNHIYILEHRSDSLIGRMLAWIGPWSRVRKADLTRPEAEPEVLVTFGRRPRRPAKKTAPATGAPAPAHRWRRTELTGGQGKSRG